MSPRRSARATRASRARRRITRASTSAAWLHDAGRRRQGGHGHHLGLQQVPRQLCGRQPRGSGNTTTYQHLSSRSVSVGTYVAQGQVVGITGTTGVSSGPHLHFEITENGQIINPLKYLTDYIKGW